jgi:hypothetical protein
MSLTRVVVWLPRGGGGAPSTFHSIHVGSSAAGGGQRGKLGGRTDVECEAVVVTGALADSSKDEELVSRDVVCRVLPAGRRNGATGLDLLPGEVGELQHVQVVEAGGSSVRFTAATEDVGSPAHDCDCVSGSRGWDLARVVRRRPNSFSSFLDRIRNWTAWNPINSPPLCILL